MMKPENIERYELLIIGGGAAGFSAASVASDLGIKTALVNDGLPIGGTCVNVGCVPSKILNEMSNRYHYTFYQSYDALKGVCTCASPIDFKRAVAEKDRLVEGLRNKNYRKTLASYHDVTYFKGKAQFLSENAIKVNEKVLRGDKIIISTGTRPLIIPIDGIDKVDYLTSREALSLSYLPKSLVVIGAGSVGLELAQMFSHFGSEVTILEKKDQISNFSKDLANELQKHLEAEGIKILTGVDVVSVSQGENTIKTIKVKTSDNEIEFQSTDLLMATSVKPNTDRLNLDKVNVNMNKKGFIMVNKFGKTSNQNIWAAGDVIGEIFLETTSARQGYNAAKNIFENANMTIDYTLVPKAIFTIPQVASVGLSEVEIQERNIEYDTSTITLDQIPKALAIKDTRGLIKMNINSITRQVLGIHFVAPSASELIHEATFIINFKLTIDDVIDTLNVFPTMSEGLKRVAQAFDRDIETMACCVN